MLFAYEQKIICSQTQLNDIAHEQTIICRQLFALHGGISADEKEDKYASNDNNSYNYHRRHQLFIIIII